MNKYIKQAIKITGSQAKLAKLCSVSRQAVNNWALRKNFVDAHSAMKIEVATNGRVQKNNLRPDLWPYK